MPSFPRYALIDHGSTFHVTWQCHNQSWLLEPDWAKRLYYELLLKYKDRYKVKIYSYCFMSSHPHLTGYCEDKRLFSDFFRVVNSCFAKAHNRRTKRRGQVVMDRFKSPRIESEADHLRVIFYNDLNPKRAKMVIHPKDYAWSSFHYYAYGKKDPLITEAPTYEMLGKDPHERRKVYLALIGEILANDWKEKKPYSSEPFIGNPDWVIQKQRELKTIQREKFTKWKNQFRQRFLDPPAAP